MVVFILPGSIIEGVYEIQFRVLIALFDLDDYVSQISEILGIGLEFKSKYMISNESQWVVMLFPVSICVVMQV